VKHNAEQARLGAIRLPEDVDLHGNIEI